MITVPIIQAFFIGCLRLAAMALAVYLYLNAHGDGPTLGFAGALGFFAITGQAIDILKVARQVALASTTQTVTLTQPADTPAPLQLAAKTEAAQPVNPGA